MKRRRLTWTLAGVTLTLLGIPILLVCLPPITECTSEVPSRDKEYWVPAIQTIAKPWLGPHHVYGVFSVPIEYRRHRLYSARLFIQGFSEDLPETSPEAGPINSSQAKSGQYLMRVNLPTRLAVWFLMTGRFGDLTKPCHWWVILADRNK
jgi:hypothetical protein